MVACTRPAPSPPEAATCRGADGSTVEDHRPGIGTFTGLPTPRDLYTSRATTFRSGPTQEDAALFRTEQPVAVTILRECGLYRLARVEGGRMGWVHASGLTIKPPAGAAGMPAEQRRPV